MKYGVQSLCSNAVAHSTTLTDTASAPTCFAGDKRWIVEERADGTNVHGWHWQERDVLAWAQQRIRELLQSLTVLESEAFVIRTSGLQSVEGEALVNNRKQKLIPSYELAVKGTWEGQVRDGSGAGAGSAGGTWELPYVSDENADEDPELKVSTSKEGAAEQRIKQAFVSQGKKALYAALRQFVLEIQAGGPVARSSQSSKAAGAQPAPGAQQGAGTNPAQARQSAAEQPRKAAQPVRAASSSSSSTHTIKLTERFYARRQDIYECFTDVRRIQAYTQSPASAQPQPGGELTLYGGSVQAQYKELEEPSKLVLRWRFSSWPSDLWSEVTICLEEPDAGNTVLELTQSGVPHEDAYGNADVEGTTRRGWQDQIFRKIRMVFGYGM